MEYDENKAIEYIRTQLSQQSNDAYSDDELLNVIDIMFDYYEESGLLEIDNNEGDDELDVKALTAYVRKMIAKDKKSPIKLEDIETIVAAELDYEETIEL